MVAPAYAKQRSELDKSLGLGRKVGVATLGSKSQAPKKRGRAKATT